MRANTQHTARGDMRQEGWEWEGQNSGEQRHWEICGWERDGAGNMGYTRWTLQGLSGRKAGNLKEVGLGWINGGRKPGVGLVVRVAAWDPRVLSSIPVGR